MIKIFLESKNSSTPEYVFINTLLRFMGVDSSIFNLIPVNGKDSLHLSANHFIQNTLEGGTNLIIFDADSTENNGGYERRKDELKEVISRLGIEAEIFLFPDDEHDGDFETMLESVARKDLHEGFFGCFKDYEYCLGDRYIHPNRKGKLYAYITSMRLSNRQRRSIGSGNWLFENNDFWNLNSPSLEPLKSFLNKNFMQDNQ